jgi:hypothetical protein
MHNEVEFILTERYGTAIWRLYYQLTETISLNPY